MDTKILHTERILILGGTGLVGRYVARQILSLQPAVLFVTSLPDARSTHYIRELKKSARHSQIEPILEDVLTHYTTALPITHAPLKNILERTQPTIIIDALNTATAFARRRTDREKSDLDALIGYYQTLIEYWKSEKETRLYIKIGTTGVGGMGITIPYTHDAEPVSFLSHKASLAGAQTAILSVCARTKGFPVIKEIKPGTAIFEPTIRVEKNMSAPQRVSIDGGESGGYALEEFIALTEVEQMHFITPNEVAAVVVAELLGESTSHDILTALNSALITPSFTAGMLRERMIKRAEALCRRYQTKSIALGSLGPQRITNMLFEIYLIQSSFKSISALLKTNSKMLQQHLEETIQKSAEIQRLLVSMHRTPQDFFKEEDGWKKFQHLFRRFKQDTGKDLFSDIHAGEVIAWMFTNEGKKRMTEKD